MRTNVNSFREEGVHLLIPLLLEPLLERRTVYRGGATQNTDDLTIFDFIFIGVILKEQEDFK